MKIEQAEDEVQTQTPEIQIHDPKTQPKLLDDEEKIDIVEELPMVVKQEPQSSRVQTQTPEAQFQFPEVQFQSPEAKTKNLEVQTKNSILDVLNDESEDETEMLPLEVELEELPFVNEDQPKKSKVQAQKLEIIPLGPQKHQKEDDEIEELPMVVGQIVKTPTPKLPTKSFRSDRFNKAQVPFTCVICKATFNEKERFEKCV